MKKKITFKCTEKITTLFNRANFAQKLLDKEIKRFFKDKSYIKELICLVSEYKSALWHEIYKTYPKVKETDTWECNEVEIWNVS